MHLRQAIAILAAGLTCSAALLADTAQTKKPAHTQRKSPAPARHAKRGVRTAKKAPAHSWRAGQMQPTPERYKEIQQALAKKGYLHGEATGVWNQDSADALRRFQQDQNLQASGKLDSLSIIALGLGPKY